MAEAQAYEILVDILQKAESSDVTRTGVDKTTSPSITDSKYILELGEALGVHPNRRELIARGMASRADVQKWLQSQADINDVAKRVRIAHALRAAQT